MFNASTFGNTADIYAIGHLVPHACQHTTVDQSHSSGDTIAKILEISGSGGAKTVSFTNPQKKKSHGVKSGDRGGHRLNESSFPVRPIHLCHICYYCPLAANQGNDVRGLFLKKKKLGEFFSLYPREN